MSKVSTQPVLPGPQEQEQVPALDPAVMSTLPPEADPGGFSERAPSLGALLPDEAISRALIGADAIALHAALTARLAREPHGPLRDALRKILADRSLFVVSERPPRLASFLGTGVELVGLPPAEKQETPFMATRAVRLFGVPVWPLGEHLVRKGRDGKLEILGRVAVASSARRFRWVRGLALGALALAGAGAALVPFAVREVRIVNGLSRPVEVRLEERRISLRPGEMAQERMYSLGTPYQVEARWKGAEKPFEVLSLEASQRAVYNVLGAAPLYVTGPSSQSVPRPLQGQTGSLESQEVVYLRGDWRDTVRVHADAGRWLEAAKLCKAVFLADPTALAAGEEAARILVRNGREDAAAFADELARRFPDEPVISQLAQDVFLALGKRAEAFRVYDALAQEVPTSAQRALLAARVAPPEQRRQSYARVRERFPGAPEAVRAFARMRLADGFPKEALELLDEPVARGPESLEDLELRVRALLSLKQYREASRAVRRFSEDPRHRSWELAVLGGRVARIAGPTTTQYVARDLIPPSLTYSEEHMTAFAVLTGDSTVTDAELKAVEDPLARDALDLARTLFIHFEGAVQRAATAPDNVLSRLDPETAAVLALELSRRGDTQAADRLFGARLALMAAREPLEAYVRSGVVGADFPMLPPGLLAAAYLVRARADEQSRLVQQSYARWTDTLGGIARRALDPKGEAEALRTEYAPPRPYHRRGHHQIQIIQIIRGGDQPPPPEPPPTPAPKPEGDRVPRPWPAP
jgi:tetratricopeptide (TPR) repeat protein